jgi:HEPN domain-containing protein
MKKAAGEWVRKAEADRVAAKKCSRNATPLHDVVCFHCQQCAEKYLKGLLEELGLSIPKTHDLDQLLTLLLPHHSSLRSLRRGMTFLSNFAVGVRYPGDNASKRQAASALRWTERTRTTVRILLGIRARRPRRKKSP